MPDAPKASGFNVEKEINYIELLRCQKMIGADFGQGKSAIPIYPSEIFFPDSFYLIAYKCKELRSC
jgi:hypothetical protein